MRLTAHARTVMAERGIAEAWVAETVARPDWTEPDPTDLALTRYFRTIPERGGRTLRVVARTEGAETVVVTAFLDRNARKPSQRRPS